MGMLACYVEADVELLDSLKELDEDELFEKVEELEEDETLEKLELDKMWDGIHFLLTGTSAASPVKGNEKSEAILGENTFLDDEDTDYIAYSYPDKVEKIVKVFEKLDMKELGELYNPSQFAQNGIYPDIWMREDEAELRQELIENIVEVKEFYQRLLCKKKGVIVSIY